MRTVLAGLRSLLTFAFGFAVALRVRFAGALAVGIIQIIKNKFCEGIQVFSSVTQPLTFTTIDHFVENGANSGQFVNWLWSYSSLADV